MSLVIRVVAGVAIGISMALIFYLNQLRLQEAPQAHRERNRGRAPPHRTSSNSNRRTSTSPVKVCTICQDTRPETDEYIQVRCGHTFHTHCLANLLDSGLRLCPNCRCNLVD